MSSAPPQRRPDPAASMSLLTELLTHPLDPAYEWEAERRRAAGRPAEDSLRSPGVFIVALIVGVSIAIAAASLRVPVGEAQKERNGLISRINTAQASINRDTTRVERLRGEITSAQTSALRKDNKGSTATDISRLAALTGDSSVTGSGFKLTLKDAPAGDGSGTAVDPRVGDGSAMKLSSTDLQVIVNGLWQAGANAIAINDQRLTSVTAIRFAGEAVLVNFRPLVPPYVISVIGPAGTKSAFDRTSGGDYLRGLVERFGVTSSTQSQSSLTLPALSISELKYAKQLKEKK